VIKCNEKKKIICEFIEAWTNSRAKLRDIIKNICMKKTKKASNAI
jgi:hypothetical protein